MKEWIVILEQSIIVANSEVQSQENMGGQVYL
jgi:hypothetical protein